MRARAVSVLCTLVLLLAAAPALAQDGNPFNGLPPAQPTPAPTATPVADTGNDDVGRATLFVIAGALLVAFVGIGWWIARDARRTLPPEERDRLGRAERDRIPHRHERQAKAKARAKGRAQRQARKAGRKARR